MHMFGNSDIFVVPVYPFPGVVLISFRKFQRHLISKLPTVHPSNRQSAVAVVETIGWWDRGPPFLTHGRAVGGGGCRWAPFPLSPCIWVWSSMEEGMISLHPLYWPTERGWNPQSCISFKRFFLQKEDSESDLKALDKMRSNVQLCYRGSLPFSIR